MDAATLSRIERGEGTPDLAVITRLAHWLNVTVQTAGAHLNDVKTDDDLKRTIAVHLRANKNLSDKVARTIAESFDLVMRVEIERAKKPRQ